MAGSGVAGAPLLLNSNDIDGVVEYMKSPQCKKIVVMVRSKILVLSLLYMAPGRRRYYDAHELLSNTDYK